MRIPLVRRAVGVWLVAAVAAVVLAASLFLAMPRPSASTAQPQAVAPVTLAAPAEIVEPAHVLVIGDSWTYGMAATERENGYAYQLGELGGWTVTVDGEPGSGYLKTGRWGNTFADRIARLDAEMAPDLIVVQGSINDRWLPEDGYSDAVETAWGALETIFPDAAIVVLGPAPQALPVETPTARIDRDLAALASARQWPYVSPIQDEWITSDNYDAVIDTSDVGRNHPSDDGHRFLAEQVAAAIRPVVPATTIDAGAEAPTPIVEQ